MTQRQREMERLQKELRGQLLFKGWLFKLNKEKLPQQQQVQAHKHELLAEQLLQIHSPGWELQHRASTHTVSPRAHNSDAVSEGPEEDARKQDSERTPVASTPSASKCSKAYRVHGNADEDWRERLCFVAEGSAGKGMGYMSEKLGRGVSRLFDVKDVTGASLTAFPEAKKLHCIKLTVKDHYVASKQEGLEASKEEKKGAPETFTFALPKHGRDASIDCTAPKSDPKHELKLWLEALLPAHLLAPLLLDLACQGVSHRQTDGIANPQEDTTAHMPKLQITTGKDKGTANSGEGPSRSVSLSRPHAPTPPLTTSQNGERERGRNPRLHRRPPPRKERSPPRKELPPGHPLQRSHHRKVQRVVFVCFCACQGVSLRLCALCLCAYRDVK